MRRWTASPGAEATLAGALDGEVWAGITFGNYKSISSFLSSGKRFFELGQMTLFQFPAGKLP
jgi:hypothetical protein